MVGEGPTPSEGRPNPPRILPLDKDLRWRVALASWGSASQTHQLPDMSRVFIQVTLNAGRSVDQKRAFYKAIADGLHERLNLRREDVFIGLVEVSKENWSFGNGEVQYAK